MKEARHKGICINPLYEVPEQAKLGYTAKKYNGAVWRTGDWLSKGVRPCFEVIE